MFIVCVTIQVLPERISEFREAIRLNHQGTRKEPGNLRFDVLQQNDDPGHFFLYEVYNSEEDFKHHQQTPHYLTWKETVQDWMAQPRKGIKFTNLYPNDAQWKEGTDHA